ncbi:MAG TPA: MFS transporter [Candidatus Limnocylindria bacterium]|nr:MFS transporter [Candidatus Limnocylindria bacterium]
MSTAMPADGRADRLRHTFVAFRQRDFRIFWLGQLVSVTGTWMQTVAQGWLILLLTGSPFILGVAAAARAVPVLILVVPAGIVADRFDRRLIIIVTTVVATIASAALAILTILGTIDVPTVLLLAVVLGVTNAFEMPARQSFVYELIGKRDLANAIALNSLLFNSARVIGPALAGILVALVGPGWAFGINAISYVPVLIGLFIIGRVHVPRLGIGARTAIPEAVRYLRGEPRVAALLGLLAAQTIFASGHLILGPTLAQDLGQGAEGFGVLLAATGAGAVVGGIGLAATSDRTERRRALLGAGVALGGGLAAVGLTNSYPVTLLCFVVAGWGMVTFNASSNTIIQTIVPDRLRGRMMSLYTLVLLGLMPVGGLLMGALATGLGSATALSIGGLAYGLIIIAGFAFVPPLRRL